MGLKNPGTWENASNWYNAANADNIRVNETPAVGSIAQWNAGGGGDGHVAYVESVSYNSSGTVTAITITEDNFMPETGQGSLDGGYTAEVQITAGASVWPANFIHAKDKTSSGGQLQWKLRNTNGSGPADTTFSYGASTDIPVVGDWDGNLTATVGIVRPDGSQLLWKLRNTNSSGPADSAFDYGASNALPTPGNWDGVGSTTPGVVRIDDGSGQLLWELRNADGPGPATYEFHYGPSDALPVVGDWDGNGTVTIGVVRQDPSTGTLLWELRNSNSSGPADIEFHYGPDGALPVVGDWDGNETATIGVVRPINGQLYWELRNSNSAGAPDLSFYYGASTDIPVVGDWDGNGTVTIGIARR